MSEVDDIYYALNTLANAIDKISHEVRGTNDPDYAWVKSARITLDRGRKAYKSLSEPRQMMAKAVDGLCRQEEDSDD